MLSRKVKSIFWAAASIFAMLACSPSDESSRAPMHEMTIAEQTEIAKRYDASTLVEVDRLADLPVELRHHFVGWMERSENPGLPSANDAHGDVPYRFMIAGASDTSALVAYEGFGFVPSTHASSYVRKNADWVPARTWDNVGYPKTLAELRNATARIETPESGR